MSENQNLPQQQIVQEANDAPDTYDSTLGRGVVGGEMNALQHELQCDLYRRQFEVGQELEALSPPFENRMAKIIGRLSGEETMTVEEYDWLKAHPTSQTERRIAIEAEAQSNSEKNTKAELARTRGILGKLTESERELVDEYLDKSASPFLQDLYVRQFAGRRKLINLANQASNELSPDQPEADMIDASWTEWLANSATDEQLTNFLQWHVNTIAEQNRSRNPAIAEAIKHKRQQYKQAVAQGITDGWLSKDAQKAIAEVDGIDVYMGDHFDTVVREMGGYHIDGKDFVVVGQGTGKTKAARTRSAVHHINITASHEWNHAVLGLFGAEWINEATTEHIAESLDYGEPEIVDPELRPHGRGSYIPERTLLNTLLKDGKQEVPVAALTRAYSADPHSLEGSLTQSTLTYLLSEAWRTEGVLAHVGARLKEVTRSLPKTTPILTRMAQAAEIVNTELKERPDIVLHRTKERATA